MITVPNSLDNYFSSKLSRRTSLFPLNININNIDNINNINTNNNNTIDYVSTIYLYLVISLMYII
jgi:hypothetical protein